VGRRLVAWILATTREDALRWSETAVRHAQRATTLEPQAWSNWDAFAVALAGVGAKYDALVAWQKAAALATRQAPGALEAIEQRQRAWMAGYEYREGAAEQLPEAALVSAWEELGLVALADDEPDEALGCFERALSLAGTEDQALRLRLVGRQSTAHDRAGDTAAAAAVLRTALADSARSDSARSDSAAELANNLAALLLRGGHDPAAAVAEAHEWAARAVAWSPGRS
jgi:tetratricopeptide (TPR) repeat protein